jgi:hypothetical protein
MTVQWQYGAVVEHQLEPGKRTIFAIAVLGQALDYVAELEFQVHPEGACVDVAFLGETGQEFPLMIFEVESRPSGGMANNAVKVFSRSVDELIKPLFFFHIVLAGSASNPRVDNLARLFGTHNYRLYPMGDGDATQLAIDILRQHRRIRPSIDLAQVLTVLTGPEWDEVRLQTLVDAVEGMNFNNDYAVAYAQLAWDDKRFMPVLLRYVTSSLVNDDHDLVLPNYPTYAGRLASPFLHTALAVHHEPTVIDASLVALRWWQEDGWFLSQIGPHLRLNRNYDLFILGVAPFIFAVCSCLATSHDAVRDYTVKQAHEIFLGIQDEIDFRYVAPTAVWLLHVSAAFQLTEIYESVSKFLRRMNGVSREWLFNPPAIIDADDLLERAGAGWDAPLIEPLISVPDLEGLRNIMVGKMSKHTTQADLDVTDIALMLLLSDQHIGEVAGQASLSTCLTKQLYCP